MAIMFEPFRKYASFRGRARRLEFWSFLLFVAAATMALSAWLAAALGSEVDWADPVATELVVETAARAGGSAWWALLALGLFQLAIILPALAVSVRRLHDIDRSGWWWWLNLVPLGGLVLLVFYLLDGTHGPNRFGEDPKGRPTPGR